MTGVPLDATTYARVPSGVTPTSFVNCGIPKMLPITELVAVSINETYGVEPELDDGYVAT